jgi:hypothetical protein
MRDSTRPQPASTGCFTGERTKPIGRTAKEPALIAA